MKQTDNPAKRLHSILSDAIKRNGGEATIKVWSAVFDANGDDAIPRVFYCLGLLHQLTFAVEDRVRRIPGLNTDLYLRAMPDIRRALSPARTDFAFNDTAGRYLNAGTMTVLEFCANELGKEHHEDAIPAEELNALRTDIDALFSDVSSADIDKDLQVLLLDLLSMMLRSIDEYRIRGAAGIRDAMAFSIGQFCINHDLYQKTKKEPVVDRFSKILARISTVVSTAIKVMSLYGKVAPILGLPTGPDSGPDKK